MSEATTKEKILFWSAVAGLSTIIVGSCYYLYKLINEEDEEEEKIDKIEKNEQKEKNEKKIFKKDLMKEEDIFDSNDQLTIEGVVKIMTQISKLSEILLAKDFPNLDKERRDAMSNETQYLQLCQESFMKKQMYTQAATEQVLSKFSGKNISMEIIQEFMTKVDQKKIEELSLLYDEPDENEKNITPEKAKEAYLFYSEMFIKESKNFQNKTLNLGPIVDEANQAQVVMEFFITKMRIDDLLFIKYNIQEQKIKGILYRLNLLDDPDIKKKQEELEELDKLLEK